MHIHGRILRLQKRIHTAIRADVRKLLGLQSAEIRRYYEAYKREFKGPYTTSDKNALLDDCVRSNIILFGDYHTFSQAQKAALKVLIEMLERKKNVTIALEMVLSEHQHILEDFLCDRISEAEYLEKTDYNANWGFPWNSFKKFLYLAKEHNLPVLGLNLKNPKMPIRDKHAAHVISEWLCKNPDQSIFTIYGDLHLARRHLPYFIKKELREKKINQKILTIFQNAELLYWKLASEKKENHIEVLKLAKNRYCIINAAPWIKLQSYLQWAESSQLLDPEEFTGTSIHDLAHERLKDLCILLGIEKSQTMDFTIQTLDDLERIHPKINQLGLSRAEKKIIQYHILANRTTLIPESSIVYLSSKSPNALAEGVSLILHRTLAKNLRVFHSPKQHFYANILLSMLTYFGSKLLNHKRKCDLEDDYRLLLERKPGRHALPGEHLQRKVAKQVLRFLQAEKKFLKEKKYRAPSLPLGPGRISLFLETTRGIGFILGEKLFAAFSTGQIKTDFVIQLYSSSEETNRKSKQVYLSLVRMLNDAPLDHTSKLEKF